MADRIVFPLVEGKYIVAFDKIFVAGLNYLPDRGPSNNATNGNGLKVVGFAIYPAANGGLHREVHIAQQKLAIADLGNWSFRQRKIFWLGGITDVGGENNLPVNHG